MKTYDKFIKENVAPQGATKIGVWNGNSYGTIPLSGLGRPKDLGSKLYSFMACSDMHKTTYAVEDNAFHAGQDLLNALDFIQGKVDFIAMTGDLTHRGESSELEAIKTAFSGKGWTMGKTGNVYTCCGNHEMYGRTWNSDNNTGHGVLSTYWSAQTGMDKNTVINKGNDVFIFFSPDNCIITNSAFSGRVYSDEDIQWLYTQLKTYRNKRCFVFTHFFFPKMCGNYGYPSPYYHYPMDAESERQLTLLLNKYRNVIWFSGHSHWHWAAQGVADMNGGRNYNANISKNSSTGYCVHLSSLGKPRKPIVNNGIGSYADETTEGANVPPSEFAIVDVYSNYIIIKGLTYINGSYQYLPVAQYCLNTSLVNVDDVAVDFSASGSFYCYYTSNTVRTADGWLELNGSKVTAPVAGTQYTVRFMRYANGSSAEMVNGDSTEYSFREISSYDQSNDSYVSIRTLDYSFDGNGRLLVTFPSSGKYRIKMLYSTSSGVVIGIVLIVTV